MKKTIASLCVVILAGCGPKDKTFEQHQQQVGQYAKMFNDLGGRGNLSVRAGRPCVGMIGTGFVFIPGVEIDASMDLDATRSVPERIITTQPMSAVELNEAVEIADAGPAARADKRKPLKAKLASETTIEPYVPAVDIEHGNVVTLTPTMRPIEPEADEEWLGMWDGEKWVPASDLPFTLGTKD